MKELRDALIKNKFYGVTPSLNHVIKNIKMPGVNFS